MRLVKYKTYTRKDVHDIFDPLTTFHLGTGSWGLHGIVKIPHQENNFVFFVTFGRSQGEHTFIEEVTESGLLAWQSQPRNRLTDQSIQALIKHDHLKNDIYLFLRTNKTNDYTYMGKLAYITHDNEREQPIYFKWRILDWDMTLEQCQIIGLSFARKTFDPKINTIRLLNDPPERSNPFMRAGLSTKAFNAYHVDFEKQPSQEVRNAGKLFVLDHELRYLTQNGYKDLANKLSHASETEEYDVGFDIQSYGLNGREKFIKVKTTTLSDNTPFNVTDRELSFSHVNSENYYLYRVYDFNIRKKIGKMYIIKGDLSKMFNIRPIQFEAWR